MGFYLERYSPIGAFENRVYEGVVEALERCADAGARLFVATSKNERDARAILEHFGLAARFESINGARLDGSRAAKRELIGDVVAAHGLNLGEDAIAMIGDREFDMLGAKAVGVAGDRRPVGLWHRERNSSPPAPTRWPRRRSRRPRSRSRDNVGGQVVPEPRHAVAQPQLALLQPLQLQAIRGAREASAPRSPRRDRDAPRAAVRSDRGWLAAPLR